MARAVSSTNSTNMITVYKETNYTANVNERILVKTDPSVGNVTITLPSDSTIQTGDIIQVIDVGYATTSATITITSNGIQVYGGNSVVLDLPGATVTFIWYSDNLGNSKWAICA